MANLDTTQTPNPVPVDTSSLITSLNTETGPQASPQSFGPSLEGLAQGLDSANQDIQQTIYRNRFEQRQTQAAQNELTSMAAVSNLDKKSTAALFSARAAGQPVDPVKFDTQFQSDVAAGADKMPNPEARASYMARATQLGLGFYKSNLEQSALYNQRVRTAQYSDLANSLVAQVNSGAISLQEGQGKLQTLAAGVGPATDASPAITNQANSDMVQGAVKNIAQTHGAGVAALAVRNGIGGDTIQQPHQEILATQLDAQQIIANETRATVAQKQVDALSQKASSGQFVSNSETMAAAKELADATKAKPVDTQQPDLTEYIQGRFDYLNKLAASVDGSEMGQIEYRAAEKMEYANDGKLIEQRLNTMTPDDQRGEINKMADAFGVDNPLVQHAGRIAEENTALLTKGKDTYDPASFAMKLPFVQAGFDNAQNAMASASNPIDQGKAQGLMKMAVEQSFTAQRLAGVPQGQEQVLTKDQAQTYAEQLSGTDAQGLSQAPKTLNQIESMYGDYAKKAILQAASTGKLDSGGAMLGMLNPDSQKVWSAVNFKAERLKPEDPDMVTIKGLMSGGAGMFSGPGQKAWSNFWQSQSTDYGAPQRREQMEAAMPNMVRSYMATSGDSATVAFNKVVADTIGHAYVTIPTDNGQQNSVPTTLVDNADDAAKEQGKANLGMASLIMANGAYRGPNEMQDQAALETNIMQKGFWHFDTANNAWARMVDNGKGVDVARIGQSGVPLMIDAKKLQALPVIAGEKVGWFGKQPDRLGGDFDASFLVQPPNVPDQTPILKAQAPWTGGASSDKPQDAPSRPLRALPVVPGNGDAGQPFSSEGDTPSDWRSGAETTHYGYGDDTTPDRNSRNGIGAFDNPLSSGAVAVSRSLEKKMDLLPGDVIEMSGQNGEKRYGYFADRTSDKLTNDRIDLYDPHGSEEKGAPFNAVSYRKVGGGSAKLKGRYLTAVGEHNIAVLEGGDQ